MPGSEPQSDQLHPLVKDSGVETGTLFPPMVLRAAIAPVVAAQCRVLCFGPYPAWDDVAAQLRSLHPGSEPESVGTII